MIVQDSISQVGKIIHQQIFSNNVMLVFWYNENAREKPRFCLVST